MARKEKGLVSRIVSFIVGWIIGILISILISIWNFFGKNEGRGGDKGCVGRLTSIRTSRLISIWNFFRRGRGLVKGEREGALVFSRFFVGFRPGR